MAGSMGEAAGLVRAVYRSVLRTAQLMDRHPHLKALVVRTDDLLEANSSALAAHEFFHKHYTQSPQELALLSGSEKPEALTEEAEGTEEAEKDPSAPEAVNPFSEAGTWSSGPAKPLDESQVLLNRAFSEALGGEHCLYYVPPHPHLPQEEQDRRTFASITQRLFREVEEDRLDVAFTMLREMNRCVKLAKHLRKLEKEEKAAQGDVPEEVTNLRARMAARLKQQAKEGSKKQARPLQELKPGAVLIAHPLQTAYFGQTVILLDKYDKESGSEGIILNKPAPFDIKQTLPAEEGHGYLDYHGFDKRALFDGGPVPSRMGTFVCLHPYGNAGSSSEVVPGVFRGVSLQQCSGGPWLNTGVVPLASSLTATPQHSGASSQPDEVTIQVAGENGADPRLATGSKRDFRMYWGKAVWIKGQLENEMRLGSWILADFDSDVLFETMEPKEPTKTVASDCQMLLASYWQGALRLLGAPYAGLAKLKRLAVVPSEVQPDPAVRIIAF